MPDAEKPKTVLVTGASSGIGRALAFHLDSLGFAVFASVRNERDAEDLCSQSGAHLMPVLMDVTDPESILHARAQIMRTVGENALFALVNNAGIGFTGPLEFMPLEDFRWMFAVNVFGLLAVTQAFLPLIRQAKGRIVNISSTAALITAPFHGTYTAAKLSVKGISDALRLELQPHGVQVALVYCGNVKTLIWKKRSETSNQIRARQPEEAKRVYGEQHLQIEKYFEYMGRSGLPPEVAARMIARALTAKRAKQTYYVGPDAQLYRFFNKVVHGRLHDWVIVRFMGFLGS